MAGANVVVYLGHGNGSPEPVQQRRVDRPRQRLGPEPDDTGGDSDDWSNQMVYCGEKALLGTLTASDGAAQWAYCGGRTNTDGIARPPTG